MPKNFAVAVTPPIASVTKIASFMCEIIGTPNESSQAAPMPNSGSLGYMETWHERLTRARNAKGIKKTALAKAVGVSQPTITDWESGEIKKIQGENLLAVCRALDVTPDWLTTGRESTSPQTNVHEGPDIRGFVPLISWIQAGSWNHAEDPLQPGDADQWMPCPARHGPRSYALRVRGDSMTAAHGKSYPEGCIIFVDPDQKSPPSGARIIAKLAGSSEVTFKVLVVGDGRTWLKPLNPQHPPILDEFRVLGTVIGKWEDE
jgi:SOS-response transcriptional repressor LexA